jgi:hypothetical protein
MANTDPAFSEAKRLHLEKYGDAIVTNTYLKIAVALLALIGLGLVALNVKTIDTNFSHSHAIRRAVSCIA